MTESSSTRDNSKKPIPDAPPAVIATAPEKLKAEVAPPAAPVAQADAMAVLGQVIGDAVAQGMAASAPRRKVSIGEYDPKTACQPDKTKTIKLTRVCFQNGAFIHAHVLYNDEIELLNGLTHSGRYIDRLVEVVLVPNGAEDEVHINYNNKTNDQRNKVVTKVNSVGEVSVFAAILRALSREQNAERLADETNNNARAARPRR